METEGLLRVRPMARWPRWVGAGMTSKVTPGGIESGAPPMLDCDCGVVENVRRKFVLVCRGRVESREERMLRLLHAMKDAMMCSIACCRTSYCSPGRLLRLYSCGTRAVRLRAEKLRHDLEVQLSVVQGLY